MHNNDYVEAGYILEKRLVLNQLSAPGNLLYRSTHIVAREGKRFLPDFTEKLHDPDPDERRGQHVATGLCYEKKNPTYSDFRSTFETFKPVLFLALIVVSVGITLKSIPGGILTAIAAAALVLGLEVISRSLILESSSFVNRFPGIRRNVPRSVSDELREYGRWIVIVVRKFVERPLRRIRKSFKAFAEGSLKRVIARSPKTKRS